MGPSPFFLWRAADRHGSIAPNGIVTFATVGPAALLCHREELPQIRRPVPFGRPPVGGTGFALYSLGVGHDAVTNP
jgi:hypothetical protein